MLITGMQNGAQNVLMWMEGTINKPYCNEKACDVVCLGMPS